jgi:hypothetical protein
MVVNESTAIARLSIDLIKLAVSRCVMAGGKTTAAALIPNTPQRKSRVISAYGKGSRTAGSSGKWRTASVDMLLTFRACERNAAMAGSHWSTCVAAVFGRVPFVWRDASVRPHSSALPWDSRWQDSTSRDTALV